MAPNQRRQLKRPNRFSNKITKLLLEGVGFRTFGPFMCSKSTACLAVSPLFKEKIKNKV